MSATDPLTERLHELGESPAGGIEVPPVHEIRRRADSRRFRRRRRRAGSAGVVIAVVAVAAIGAGLRNRDHRVAVTAGPQSTAPQSETAPEATCNTPAPSTSSGTVNEIDYIDFVQLNGITYVSDGLTVFDGTFAADAALGPPVATVCRELSSTPGDPFAKLQDRDAGFLPVGTPVYSVDGLDPRTLLVADHDGRRHLYEADTNPAARAGSDLIDLHRGLAEVTILDGANGTNVLGTITDPATLSQLSDDIATAHVDQTVLAAGDDSERWFIQLMTSDGYITRRAFWRTSGELHRGIFLGPAAVAALNAAVASN